MKNKIIIITLLLFSMITNAQIAEKLIGKHSATVKVTTEFADSQYALAEVEKNTQTYCWLAGTYNFNEDGTFAFTKQDKTIEKGRYSADETRIKLIFDADALPELNAYKPSVTNGIITVPFSIGMTKVNLLLKK